MYTKIITTLLVTSLVTSAFGQQFAETHRKKFLSDKLTTDLSVGVPVLQIVSAQKDWLVSNQTQYNVNRRLNFVSYTGLQLYYGTFRDTKDCLKTNHSYSVRQRFGIGTTFCTKGTSNGFFLMGGYKYTTVKATMSHPDFPEQVTTYSSLTPDYGVMYNLKVGKRKYFFSGKLYMPLNKLPLEFVENATVELGAGIRLIR